MMRGAWILVSLMAVGLGLGLPALLPAQPPGPVEYREHLVPEEDLRDLIDGLMPMSRQDFEELSAGGTVQLESTANQVHIRDNRLAARFEQGQLVDGTARLQVTDPGSEAKLLSLDPCRLPISRVRWTDTQLAPRMDGNDEHGRFAFLVDRPAELQLEWSMQGEMESAGRWSYGFALPPSSVIQLRLDLPSDAYPVCDGAIVRPLLPSEFEMGPPREDERRWLLELGATNVFELRIQKQLPKTDRPSATARYDLEYQFTSAGLELVGHILLHITRPLGELELQVDKPLQVATARWGDQPLRLRPGSAETVIIEFPEPLEPGQKEIYLRALAPMTVGELWSLPMLRLPDVVWQQQRVVMDVPFEFELQKLVVDGFIERAVEPLPFPRNGESRSFQAYTEDAQLRIQLANQTPVLNVTSGCSVRVGDGTITLRQVSQVVAQEGEQFLLDLITARDWIVDSIETIPESAFDSLRTAGTRRKRLRVRLNEPVTANRSLKLVIQAHRHVAGRNRFNSRELRAIQFLDVAREQRTVALQAEAPAHVQMINDASLERVGVDGLTELEAELLETIHGAVMYRDSSTATAVVQVREQQPVYSARIALEAVVDGSSLRQTYRVRCEPDAGSVSRLLVHFNRPASTPIQWETSGEADGIVSARKRPDGEETGPGETWELTLRRPMSSPFEVHGIQRSDFPQTAQLTLASAPESDSQSATLTLASADGTVLYLQGDTLKSIPPPSNSKQTYPTPRMHYRYDPSSNADLVVARVTDGRLPFPVWVWNCRLESQFDRGGNARHEALMRVENLGAKQIRLEFPRTIRVDKVFVNDAPLALASAAEFRDSLVIPLPSEIRYSTIQVTYHSQEPELGIITKLEAPWPTFDVPCLQRTWNIWLAPGFQVPRGTTPWEQLRWDERLFGVRLLRRGERPFDLTSVSDWKQWYAGIRATTQLQRIADSALMGLRDGYAAAESNCDWGTLLAQWESSGAAQAGPLLVDVREVDAVGVMPSSPVRAVGNRGELASPAYWLSRDHLALVVYVDGLLLTTQSRLTDHAPVLLGTPNSNVLLSPLRRLFGTEGQLPDERVLLTPREWQSRAIPSSADWSAPHSPRPLGVGWSHYQQEVSTTNPPQVTAIRVAVVHSSTWALLLVAAGLSLCLARRQRLCLPALLLLTAALVLILPLDFLLPARGAFLGCLLGSGLALVTRRKRRPIAEDELYQGSGNSSVASSWSRATAGGLMVAAAWASASWLDAPLIAEETDPKKPPPFSVFVPIGEDLQPKGDYVYVPPEIYDTLYRRAALGGLQTRDWLIHSASYDLATDPASYGQPATPALRGTWEISTYHPQTQVVLPVDRQQLRFLQLEMAGQRVPWKWVPDGLGIEFPTAGRHRVTMSCRPTIARPDSNYSVLKIRVPPVARATLQLEWPSIDHIDLPNCIGSVAHNFQTERQRLTANLGPIDEIQLRLPTSIVDRGYELAVDQLNWLQAQFDAVAVDVQFNCSVGQGEVRRLRILADPQLVLQAGERDANIKKLTMRPFDPQSPAWRIIDIELERSYFAGSEFPLKLRFQIAGRGGVGPVEIPSIVMEKSVALKTWLAVSSPGNLQPQLRSGATLEAIAAAEFLEAWGGSLMPPNFAYRLPGPDTDCTVEFRPQPGRAKVEQQLLFRVGREEGKFELQINADVQAGRRLRQEIEVPANCTIREVTVSHFPQGRLLRWAREPKGHLTVFFDQPLNGAGRMTVKGTMPLPREGTAELPQFSLTESELISNTVHLYRQPEVLLSLSEEVEATRRVDDPWPNDRFVRHVASFTPKPGNSATVIHTDINRLRVAARLINELWYLDEHWHATVDVDIRVQQGVLDYVRLPLTPEWNELQITPPLPYSIETMADSTKRVLVLRPEQQVPRRLQVRIRARLEAVNDEPFRVPDMSLLDLPAQRFVLLPNQVADQQLAWDVSGMVEAELPSDYDHEQLTSRDSTAFRVVTATPRATVHDIERVDRVPEVFLADYFYSLRQDGTIAGVAAFDLEPGRRRYCELVMPPGFRLVQATVSGLPATVLPVGTNRWSFRLTPDQMPQRLEVLFDGQVTGNAAMGPRTLPAPWLADLPVRRTLWSLAGPLSAERLRPLLTHSQVSWAEQEKMRFEATQQMLRAGSNVAARTASDDREAGRWLLSRRQRRTQTTLAGTVAKEAGSPDDVRLPSAEVATLDLASVWLSHPRPGRLLHCAVQGDAPSFIVYRENGMLRRVMTTALFAVGGLGLVWLLWQARRWPRLREFMVRFPHAAAMLIGLTAWWLLSPSLAGLLVAAVALLGLIRPAWRYQL